MKIDLTCPIEIRGYELTCDEEGGARAYIRMNNLAAHPISRFDAVACWSNSQTGQSEAQTFRVDQLDADARSEFPFTLAAFAVPHADTVDIHFNRVRFADGTADWIGGQAETIDIDELPLLSDEETDLLCDIAGDDAVRFPELHEKHWVCVCGRANYLHHETCSRCGRERDEVLNQCNRENILSRKTVRPYASENDSLCCDEELNLQDALRRFRYQREILLRRTMTMGIVIMLLLGFSVVSDYREKIDAARRGAIPPTLTVSVNQP